MCRLIGIGINQKAVESLSELLYIRDNGIDSIKCLQNLRCKSYYIEQNDKNTLTLQVAY